MMTTIRHVLFGIMGMWWPDKFFRCDRCDSWEHDRFYVDDGNWYHMCRACRRAERS